MAKSKCFSLIALFFLSAALKAQFETSEVLGTVRDDTGAVVAKATVTLLEQETGIESKATTDENGNYHRPHRAWQFQSDHQQYRLHPGGHALAVHSELAGVG